MFGPARARIYQSTTHNIFQFLFLLACPIRCGERTEALNDFDSAVFQIGVEQNELLILQPGVVPAKVSFSFVSSDFLSHLLY